jgi:hypothetical protein
MYMFSPWYREGALVRIDVKEATRYIDLQNHCGSCNGSDTLLRLRYTSNTTVGGKSSFSISLLSFFPPIFFSFF